MKVAENGRKNGKRFHPHGWAFAGSGATPYLKEDLSFPIVFEIRGCGVFCLLCFQLC
ncbi:hypothetical protein J7E50_10870 [Pedobacter sp. ISL-68]|uniref:hypothetical protein n=1 Tax=unclassified Pedobacter TaxID=2628915 RepID=UPI001BE74DDE|nr:MULTISPECIES: hypothetical protein [unclassified Pedobacter]MBT2561334.1 hypothetical protein [Pedobacter sp. ISL-64]MBT2590723.1 hypothetical protein [Pedobacter sp. ISL-68]